MSDDTVEIRKLRTPERKEARQFIQAMKGLLVAARQPGGEDGEKAEKTVSYWIAKLSGLTAEEVDELPHWEALKYEGAMNDMLAGLLERRPSKKRS